MYSSSFPFQGPLPSPSDPTPLRVKAALDLHSHQTNQVPTYPGVLSEKADVSILKQQAADRTTRSSGDEDE